MISIVQIHSQLTACKLWTLEQAIQRFAITTQHLPFLSSRYIASCLMEFFCDVVQQSKVVFFFLCNVILLSVYFQSCIDECLYRGYCKGLRE